LLRNHERAVEHDLSRFHHIDYRDRRRFDETGRRRLTLRMISVRLDFRWLPDESAILMALNGGERPWSRLELVTADNFTAVTGETNPRLTAREDAQKAADRESRRAASLERKRQREAAIAHGDIPLT